MIDIECVLEALLVVQSCILAASNRRSGTAKTLKASTEKCATAVRQWAQELREHPEQNPFAADTVYMDVSPYGEGTPQ
jgi:hypothetical protein